MAGHQEIVKSGDYFKVDGFYRYHEHVGKDEGCFVPDAARYMLFKRGQKATKLGSCTHEIEWKLITEL